MTEQTAKDGGRDIFIVSNAVNELGGVATWSHQMAQLFAARGNLVHMVGITPPTHAFELAADLPYGTTTLYDAHPPSVPGPRGIKGKLNLAEHRRRAARTAGMHEQAAKLTRMFRKARPGAVVIVTQVWAMEWVALADTSTVTVIGMTHESFETCRRSSRFGRVKRFYKDVDRLLALTREDADLWAQQRLDNVDFMPNPLPFFPETPSPRTSKHVVSIGRLHEEKGTDLLLDAWAGVAPLHPGWTLRIYGSGSDEETLRRQCTALGLDGSVEWMGRTDDPAGALRDGAVFTLASRGEGFPLSLLEAMATGVPCVAFDVAPGIREIIRDGEDGLLAPPGDTLLFARRLETLLADQDLRDRFGDAARENIQRYRTDEIVRRWEDLFSFLQR
ncbi:glycosyltransferase [Streptomyces sp. NBC_00083]|uniref:glycosyltransferase n=1 Tax=Streptomyces sp. NBC_00083 TaxID=2975647 RepID=UPI0022513D89|nr:glycosyltransferase [Streptomyces sp. NBC_00083]MCX5382463.1 glycosyltransferase [Streptomyces sp. NBC_00083]